MKCPTCGVEYEEVDYPVVWPHPGSCLCSAFPTGAQKDAMHAGMGETLKRIGYYDREESQGLRPYAKR